MTLVMTTYSEPPRKQRGQGAVEAILALPVFLILVCLIVQFFLLGIAQIQLQYAAFYAARVGSVNSANMVEMKRTVKRILAGSLGISPLSEDSFDIEILDSEVIDNKNDSINGTLDKILRIRVYWNYPLIVPIIDRLPHLNKQIQIPGRPFIQLKASWAIASFSSISGDKRNVK